MTDCKPIPCPWSADALQAYARGSLPAMHQMFQKQAAAQQKRIRQFGANESRILFQRLRSEGMKSTVLGFDFTALHRAFGRTQPQNLLAYLPVKLGLELLVFPTAATTEGSTRSFGSATRWHAVGVSSLGATKRCE